MKSEIIFFLQILPSLPKNYFLLAQYLKKKNIDLIPVTIFNFQKLLTNQRANVIVLNDSLMANKNYKFIKRKHLDFMMINARIVLIEISSFDRPCNISRPESKGLYHYLTLPATLIEITNDLHFIVSEEKENSTKWPGGRRTTLPPLLKSA